MAQPPNVQTVNQQVAGRLMSSGLLKPEQFEAVMQHIGGTSARFEDAVLELGVLGEAEMLKALAAQYQTRFVSTEKLSKADIVRATLEMVPRKVAEAFAVFPIMFEAASGALSVVTCDPCDADLLREIQLASGAREIRAFLARPAAVRAAIAKAYIGDIHAFAILDRQAHAQFSAMLDVYERNLVSENSLSSSLAREGSGSSRGRIVSEKELVQAAASSSTSQRGGSFGGDELLELLNVVLTLLEANRQDLRGHSAQVARLTRRLLERMNVAPGDIRGLVAAAYLHDVGKMGQYHLTPLNVGQYDGHKIGAQKGFSTPRRLLESVRLSNDTVLAFEHMYERYDGSGFPDGMAGKEIPLGARALAITDTYADLTQNPKNPYRKTLSPAEACTVLAQYKETLFDPHLVDLFKNTVMGEDLRARLLANRYLALLVDPDPEETTVLELRLIEQGFEVTTARSAEQAMKLLAAGEFDVVVSELDLPRGDGLTLLAEARAQPWGKSLLWVMHTRRQGRVEAQRAFELGVADFVAKPAPTDVLVAKLKSMLDQRSSRANSRGVQGSLREMGLAELVQVLFHGRKTGNLRVRTPDGGGEMHFRDGALVNALFGNVRGADAVYAMLKLKEGEFGLDPTFQPGARIITESPEALLLEGMRRLDEGV